MLNAIPTKSNLQRRGIAITSVICDRCGSMEENIDHCFFACEKVDALWRKVWAWCRLSGDRLDSLQALKSKLLARNALGSRAELRKAVLMVTV